MLRFILLATLLLLLAVNIIFLLATTTKDKPPDPPATTSTFGSVLGRLQPDEGHHQVVANGANGKVLSRNQRRLVLRSNDFYDYSSSPASPPTTATMRSTPASGYNGATWNVANQDNETRQQRQPNESTSTSKLYISSKWKLDNRKQETNNIDDDDDDDDGGGGDENEIIIKSHAGGTSQSERLNSIELDKTNKNNETATTRPTKSLSIHVKSSKNHVFISVDGNVIYESKSRLYSTSAGRFDQLESTRKQRRLRPKELVATKPIQVVKTTTTTTGNGNDKDDDDDDDDSDQQPDELARGIHVVVLNQFDGFVMSQRLFDTYSPWQDDELCLYLRQVQDGRLIVFAVRDEASFKLAQNSPARLLLQQLGSKLISRLHWRDMWAFVVRKNSLSETSEQLAAPESSLSWQVSHKNQATMNLAEGLSKSRHFSEWAPPLELRVEVPLLDRRPNQQAPDECNWTTMTTTTTTTIERGDDDPNDELERRRQFCSRIEGYGRVCDCKYPTQISFARRPLELSQLSQVPIVVIASNRPYYLFRMLKSLLQAEGVEARMVIVFIDGFYEEPLAVCKLFNVRVVQQRPLTSGRANSRISHHYKTSLTATFELFPSAKFAIIFEEDLDVSRDVIVYFNQTLELLESDESLYCVSAWNDQGYEHSSGRDGNLIYRIETMPGLGWMLSRRLYKEELEPRWPPPEQAHDWDMWIRTGPVRKGRECLIPDISRTFHFGSTGTNINSYFQRQYFNKHNFYLADSASSPTTKFNTSSLNSANYETLMAAIISAAHVIRPPRGQQLNGSQQLDYLCSMMDTNEHKQTTTTTTTTTRHTNSKANVIFIQMIDANDFGNWLKLAKCWRLWDLDARGQHKSTWRLFLNGRPLLVVGVPAAPYAHLKPADLKPFNLL